MTQIEKLIERLRRARGDVAYSDLRSCLGVQRLGEIKAALAAT